MRFFQLFLIAFFNLCFYVIAIFTSYIFYNDNNVLDTFNSEKTIFMSGARMAVYDRHKLMRGGKQVVFIGASNVLSGFHPDEVSAFFPNVPIHNIAVGGADIARMKELVQLVVDAVPTKDRADLTIVLGVWYGSFIHDEVRRVNGKSQIARDMLRYGFYRENDVGLPSPIINSSLMPHLDFAIRPLIVTSYLASNLKSSYELFRSFLRDDVEVQTINLEDHHLTDAEKRIRMNAWMEHWGQETTLLGSNEFDTLHSIVTFASHAGTNLILLDLPIPSWHRNHVPWDITYEKQLRAEIHKFSTLPGFSYGDMRTGFNDDDFIDATHPRQKITKIWAARVAPIIRTAVTPNPIREYN